MVEQQPLPPAGVIQFVPTVERILYGEGVVETHLAQELNRLGGERVLLVMPRSLQTSPQITQIREVLGSRLASIFTGPLEHVPLDEAVRATAAARRCQADSVVAFGGGSVIDTGKAVRTCLAAELTSTDALRAFFKQPVPPQGVWVPQLSIPTTLSGSEYTRSFSATDFTQEIKHSYTQSEVASRVIFYDPVAAGETPNALWLASGVMAIDHAVEVFCSLPEHLVGDVLKQNALQTLLQNLPITMSNPADLGARVRCQVAAWQSDHSPLRSQPLNPFPAALHSHALAYDLGALCKVPYGLSACVTLPACLRWSAAHQPHCEMRQAGLSRAVGISAQTTSDPQAVQELARALQDLIAGLGLPTRLRDIGIDHVDIQRLAQAFSARGAVPPQVGASTVTEMAALLEQAW